MSIKIDGCQLEIDSERGVVHIYSPEGFAVLRICGLPAPMPTPSAQKGLDITLKMQDGLAPHTFNWEGWNARRKYCRSAPSIEEAQLEWDRTTTGFDRFWPRIT